MDFEIAVVAVGLAREQAFELAPRRLCAQFFERGLGFGDDRGLALGFAQFDQFERVRDLAFDAAIAADRLVEPGALAHQFLRRRRVVPELRVLGLGVQFGEAAVGGLPVKDASSAAPATF